MASITIRVLSFLLPFSCNCDYYGGITPQEFAGFVARSGLRCPKVIPKQNSTCTPNLFQLSGCWRFNSHSEGSYYRIFPCFVEAALSTMHCAQTFLSTYLCYQVDMCYRIPCMMEYNIWIKMNSESVFKVLENNILRRPAWPFASKGLRPDVYWIS